MGIERASKRLLILDFVCLQLMIIVRLRFEESYKRMHQVVYVSATPGPWEIQRSGRRSCRASHSSDRLAGSCDRSASASGQVDDCLAEIRMHVEKGGRVLVTTLTKRLI